MKINNLFVIYVILSLIIPTLVPVSAFIPETSPAIHKIPSGNPIIDKMVLVEGNPNTMSVNIEKGRLHIRDTLHTQRTVRLDYVSLWQQLDGFNGHTVGYTHIADDGTATHKVVDVGSYDSDGYVSIEMEFSEVIISGFIGTTTQTYLNQNGNQSFGVPNGTLYDLNITNNEVVAWESSDGKTYQNKSVITINGSMVTTESGIQLQLYTNLEGVNGSGDIGIGFNNESGIIQAIAREVEWVWDNDNVSIYFPFDTIADVDSEIVVLWTADNNTEPAADSIYGSEAVWSGSRTVLHMGQEPNGAGADTILDSTGNDNDGTQSGFTVDSLAAGDFSNGIHFDGSNDYISLGSLSTSTAIAFDFVFTLDQINKVHRLVSKHYLNGGSGASYYMEVTSANELLFVIYDGGNVNSDAIVTSGLGLVADTLYAVSFSIDASNNAEIVVAGVSKATDTLTYQLGTSTSNAWIGDLSAGGADLFDGVMYGVQIEDAAHSSNYMITTTKNRNNPTASGINPFYLSIGETKTPSETRNITASITGDSNEQTYNTSQSREFTLTPIGTTNTVDITTTSEDYDITITTYWTENTIKYSEVVVGGYANLSIEYTPSNNVTDGVINGTYTSINFIDHDYVGPLSLLRSGVDWSGNATRTLNDVNTTTDTMQNGSTYYYNFTVPYNPPVDLVSPNDTSTRSYAYPPLTHDVPLEWNATTGAYKYTVVDYDSGAVIVSGTTTTTTKTVELSSGHYKWWINGYDDVFDEYSVISEVRSFTVEDTYSYNGTVVHGVVFEYIQGVQTPLDEALVNIWNSTWSGSSMTGSNGYFVFQDLDNSTYSMRATKTSYLDSSIELVTPSHNETLTRNILMQDDSGAGSQYVDHFVRFVVKSLFGTLYSGVTVNVYLGDSISVFHTGTTGTDGSIVFELNENQEYRITFIDALQSIDEEIILYPVKTEYPVYIIKSLLPDDDDLETEEVVVSISTAEINDTHAYINVTYTDAMNETTDLNIFINQSNEGDPFNQTVITSAALGAISSVTQSFLISNYIGQAYFVNIGATHTTFDSVKRTYAVRFDGMAEDYGFGRMWVWLAVGGMMLLAGMFKASKAEQGALIVCIAGWIFMAMGMFDVLGSVAKASIVAGLGMGTALAVMALMSKKDRDDTT